MAATRVAFLILNYFIYMDIHYILPEDFEGTLYKIEAKSVLF